jgi:hypothetical protein
MTFLNRFPCAAESGTVGTAGQGFDGQRVVRRRVRCAHSGRSGDESCSAVGVKLSKRMREVNLSSCVRAGCLITVVYVPACV